MLTDFFACSRGVRQGYLLSPILFALFLDDLAESISKVSSCVSLGDLHITTLLYPDDFVLI